MDNFYFFFNSAISVYPASVNFNRSDPHSEKSRQFHNIFVNQLYPGSAISITLLGNAEQNMIFMLSSYSVYTQLIQLKALDILHMLQIIRTK